MQTEPQQRAIAVVGRAGADNGECAELLRSQPDPAELPRCVAYQAEYPEIRAVDANGFHPHWLAEQRSRKNLPGLNGNSSFRVHD